MSSCALCSRPSLPTSTLCGYHQEARKKVESAYATWNEAYGGVAWKDYLHRIIRRPETGRWAKEVAELLYTEAKSGEGEPPG